MQIQKTFTFSFSIEGRAYSFTVHAETKEEAITRLAKDLGIIVNEIAESIV